MQQDSKTIRLRRLRQHPVIRNLVRQVQLNPEDLIYPLFVTHGNGIQSSISSMPGQYQWSIDQLSVPLNEIDRSGVQAVILFGIPEKKDPAGSGAYDADGIIQRAIGSIKSSHPDLLVIADTCLCEYTDHGHCGIVNRTRDKPAAHLPTDMVLNDETLHLLEKTAISQVQAGADVVAPSGMMDHMVSRIRTALDGSGYQHVPIMSYSVKYASAYYGPFREAAQGAPQYGDRRTHQMDPANDQQFLREVELDIAEGADFLMVKPALAYLDVIQQIKTRYPEMPLVAYNVSGEYAMLKAAAEKGWLDEKTTVLETLLGMKRAGADLMITYHAIDVANWLKT